LHSQNRKHLHSTFKGWFFNDPSVQQGWSNLLTAGNMITFQNPSKITLGSQSIVFYNSRSEPMFAAPYLKTGMRIQTDSSGQLVISNKQKYNSLRLLEIEYDLTIVPHKDAETLSITFDHIEQLKDSEVQINIEPEVQGVELPVKIDTGNTNKSIIDAMQNKITINSKPVEDYDKVEIVDELPTSPPPEPVPSEPVPPEPEQPTPETSTPDNSGGKSGGGNTMIIIIAAVAVVVVAIVIIVIVVILKRKKNAKKSDDEDVEFTLPSPVSFQNVPVVNVLTFDDSNTDEEEEEIESSDEEVDETRFDRDDEEEEEENEEEDVEEEEDEEDDGLNLANQGENEEEDNDFEDFEL